MYYILYILMGKVYLSLEELHKKHGISPAVLAAIKKKEEKEKKQESE